MAREVRLETDARPLDSGAPGDDRKHPRILLVRTSAMGDIVHCLPVLKALRQAWPEAHIGWVAEAVFAPLIDGHPDLNELIRVRLKPWRKAPLSSEVWREVSAFVRRLRAFSADIALDLMGNHKGGILARLSGAKRVLGPARGQRREPSSALWIRQAVNTPQVHAVDRALGILGGLGIQEGRVDFGAEGLPKTPVEGLPDGPFVVIQAGAGWGNKTYPSHWWGEVAHGIERQTGIPSLVPIAPGEEELARQVAGASRGSARTIDAGPFPMLTTILDRGRLVLGGDTGPIHLAHALGTPVLSLIGPTDPARNGPHASQESVLWKRLPCSFCYKRMSEAKACLLQISPREVTERAVGLLAGERGV